MRINFFTLVLNGMPFIKYHIEIFKNLKVPWMWHIVEGVADLVRDTAWSVPLSGKITDKLHKNGLSNDGTTEYLDELSKEFPENVRIYRKPHGAFWDGRVEMCNTVVKNINEECLLWQVDVDEIWETWKIEKMYRMFLENPEKTAAWFICRYFVGKDLVVINRNVYGNRLNQEWLRVWKFKPGMFWYTHSPPVLCIKIGEKLYDVGRMNPFTHSDTEKEGLIFDHYAYVLPKQLEFKETYYGYKGALKNWERLQNCRKFPVYLRNFFPWVKDNAIVDRVQKFSSSGNVLVVRTDAIGDHVLFSPSLRYIKEILKNYRVHLLTQSHVAELFKYCPYVDEVLTFDRDRAISDSSYLTKLLNMLRKKNFDIAIYPVYSREILGDILTLGSHARHKITMSGSAERMDAKTKEINDNLYDHLVEIPGNISELEKNRVFVEKLSVYFDYPLEITDFFPDIWIGEEDTKRVLEIMNQLQIKEFVVICPTALVPIRYWGTKKWAELIDELTDFHIVITASGNERHMVENIIRKVKHKKIANLSGKLNLRELAFLLFKARLVISLESAPAHIATAVGTPSVVIIGGGHFGRFMPYSPLHKLVYKKMDCFGCNWNCMKGRPLCIQNIEVSDVIKAVWEILDGQGKYCYTNHR